jgi:hypothetical protein
MYTHALHLPKLRFLLKSLDTVTHETAAGIQVLCGSLAGTTLGLLVLDTRSVPCRCDY